MEILVFILAFLLGIAVGYIWRDQISRARHHRARRERRQMKQLDASTQFSYGSQAPSEE